jgi:hypothetical protein
MYILDVLKAKKVESGVPLHGNELNINKLIFWFRVHLYIYRFHKYLGGTKTRMKLSFCLPFLI